eukprot:scpid94169/ scgid6910/ 
MSKRKRTDTHTCRCSADEHVPGSASDEEDDKTEHAQSRPALTIFSRRRPPVRRRQNDPLIVSKLLSSSVDPDDEDRCSQSPIEWLNTPGGPGGVYNSFGEQDSITNGKDSQRASEATEDSHPVGNATQDMALTNCEPFDSSHHLSRQPGHFDIQHKYYAPGSPERRVLGARLTETRHREKLTRRAVSKQLNNLHGTYYTRHTIAEVERGQPDLIFRHCKEWVNHADEVRNISQKDGVGKSHQKFDKNDIAARVLERYFNKDPKPSANDCPTIAEVLGAEEEAVELWFQNHRSEQRSYNS